VSLPAVLVLEDGTCFEGQSVGIPGESIGEVVFNTAMTGYQEILSDPSYARQIVTLTYPHIGNVGTNPEDQESTGVQVAGLVVRDVPPHFSNWRARQSLPDFLQAHQVVAIAGIDTRKLTRILREKGAQVGCLQAGTPDLARAAQRIHDFPGMQGLDLAREVTVAEPYEWLEGSWQRAAPPRRVTAETAEFHVVAYDFGIKQAILRMLADRGCRITVVPAQTPAEVVLEQQPDGVFLSNGPGDPEPCDYAIAAITRLCAAQIPVFGICLGHQLLGLASGARTVKMKFGHHGANHPVQDLQQRVHITSQNHGFAVDDADLPDCLEVTHRSLFDGSLQGIRRRDAPAFGFQGHPEASPGPHDMAHAFDAFLAAMRTARG
jgi:carbamoyl-phosphate synthase small subunit